MNAQLGFHNHEIISAEIPASVELMVAGVVVLCLYACQFLVPREWV